MFSNCNRKLTVAAVGLLVLGITSSLLLGHFTARSPSTNHLDRRPGAEWIIYPAALMTMEVQRTNLTVQFRREFVLDRPASSALVRVAACRSAVVMVNGTRCHETAGGNSWRQTTTVDAHMALRTGTNEVVVEVSHDHGPPALWFTLEAGAVKVATDEQWTTAAVAGHWQPARLATSPAQPGPGNAMDGGPSPSDVMRQRPVWLLGLILLATGVLWVAEAKSPTPKAPQDNAAKGTAARGGMLERLWQSRRVAVVPWLLTGLWVALFINNLSALPPRVGFDCDGHMDYVHYVQTKMTLPMAHEGWEMFQSPLYYVVSALWLEFCGQQLPAAGAVTALRCLGMIIGIANFWFVWGSLRLVFPEHLRCANLGAVLAALLPPVVYLGHYVTNEAAAGTAASGVIYYSLRLLRTESPSLKAYLGLGGCLGIALLTKISTGLLLPAVLAALVWKQITEPGHRPAVWLTRVGAMMITTGVLAGWMFIRNVSAYGKPVVGAWDPALGFSWWQMPGYTTSSYFTQMSGGLNRPWYAGVNSFGGGLYSTLWGDGLGGGAAAMTFFPPWNLDLMLISYWLAVPLTILAIIGFVRAIAGWVIRPSATWILLLGLLGLTIQALGQMALVSPYYCAIKCFYGLTALVPMCAIVVLPAKGIAKRWRWLSRAGTGCLLIWAANSYCSFWIRHGEAPQLMGEALCRTEEGRFGAVATLTQTVVQQSPRNADARYMLVDALQRLQRHEAALAAARQGVELNPQNSFAWISLAISLAQTGEQDKAHEAALRAVQHGPENMQAHLQLARLLISAEEWRAAREAVNQGLEQYPWSRELLAIAQSLEAQSKLKSE